VITEPMFYAAAVPAVFLMGLSKSGFGAGFGALAVPLMALTIPVPQAAAVMLPLLCLADFSGLAALARHADWRLLRFLIPAGLLGSLIGWASFGMLPVKVVAGIVGAVTLLFVALRLFFPPKADVATPHRGLGWLLGIASGYTSFIAHAGAPPISFYVMPLKLEPLRFSGTMAVFFTIVNLSKWIPYWHLGLIDLGNLGTSLALGPVVLVGVWAGVRLATRVKPTLFYQLVMAGMVLSGLKLLWDAWR
jgi:uncharacterized protein